MAEVDDLLRDAWQRVRARLVNDPAEVRRRLERGRNMWAKRPPRAWCLAVRASDHRINPASAICQPEHAAYAHAEQRHKVTLDAQLLRELCAPITLLPYGEPFRQVAKKVGRSKECLNVARVLGVFDNRYVLQPGCRGKPIPVLSTKGLLDPGQRLLAPADRVWSWTGKLWYWRVPEALPPQAIVRVPYHYDRTACYRDKEDLHPEHPALDPAHKPKPDRRLPPPPPDPVWYKWKGDEYIGYDWRAAEKNPRIRLDYERQQRGRQGRSERAKRRRREGMGPPSQGSGSLLFRGWRWLCPVCERRVKVIFYPLPPINVLRGYGSIVPDALIDPQIAQLGSIEPLRRASGFACDTCHGVRPFCRVDRNGWNETVCYLSGGLLYGAEVPRPDWLTPDRKRPYRSLPSRAPSERRMQMQERLLKGWSYKRIARDLGIAEGTVMGYASRLYAQHGVHTRSELARKLGVPPAQCMTTRQQIRLRVEAGEGYEQIADEMGMTLSKVRRYVSGLGMRADVRV